MSYQLYAHMTADEAYERDLDDEREREEDEWER